MTLPASGLITLQDVNVELGKTANAAINLNDTDVRTLLGKTTGAISIADAYGKAKVVEGYMMTVGTDGAGAEASYGWMDNLYGSPFGSMAPATVKTPWNTNVNALYSFFLSSGEWWLLCLTSDTTHKTIKVVINGVTYTIQYDSSLGPAFHSAKISNNPFILGEVVNVVFI